MVTVSTGQDKELESLIGVIDNSSGILRAARVGFFTLRAAPSSFDQAQYR